ncbi:MAG: hypothetical protein WAK79_06440, partial [Exiguobacterium chiriqhucha]
MTRKSFYPARRYHGRSTAKRMNRTHVPHTLPIHSIVEEAQDAVCYIDFTRNHLYSNEQLRAICPSMVNQRFSRPEDMTR